MNFREQLLFNLGPGPAYEPAREAQAAADSPVRLIAYYLPQYHRIPENDLWWGKGFTEWTNVTKAVPRFSGHYQPHLPGELGFYDLRLADTLHRQADLARQYGLHGFCFHYYWFHGRRLLETPLLTLLNNPEIDVRFCINWANESWTRSWDGEERDILVEQTHSEQDDFAFAEALAPIVRDPRYIKVDGRPLVMLYRPKLLPDAAATLRRWRSSFLRLSLGDPFLVMAQCFGDNDPRTYGFNAAAEFPPHKVGWNATDIAYQAKRFAGDSRCRLLSYDQMVSTAMREATPDFTLFRGVCPGWDNEARKPNRGVCFVNGTPDKYFEWLTWSCRNAMRVHAPEHRIVFINAWNEWAEGAHLEPDRHYGYAYLNATVGALQAASLSERSATVSAIHGRIQGLAPEHMNLAARLKSPLRQIKARLAGAFGY